MTRPSGFGAAFDPLALAAAPRQRVRSTPERFWARVDRDGPVARIPLSPCWLWTGLVGRHGYGHMTWCYLDVATHRLAAALTYGPLPAGAVVLHACDVRACCNPAHLSVGTIADNNEDMRAKGRLRWNPDIVKTGADNPLAKLVLTSLSERSVTVMRGTLTAFAVPVTEGGGA